VSSLSLPRTNNVNDCNCRFRFYYHVIYFFFLVCRNPPFIHNLLVATLFLHLCTRMHGLPSFFSRQVIPYLLVWLHQVRLVMLLHQDLLYLKQAQLYYYFRYFYLVIITEALCKDLGVQLTAPVPVTQLLMLLHKSGKRKPSRETVLSYHIDSIIYTLTWQSNTLFEKYSSVWLSLSFWITVLNCTRIFKKKYAKKLSKKVHRITALVSLYLGLEMNANRGNSKGC